MCQWPCFWWLFEIDILYTTVFFLFFSNIFSLKSTSSFSPISIFFDFMASMLPPRELWSTRHYSDSSSPPKLFLLKPEIHMWTDFINLESAWFQRNSVKNDSRVCKYILGLNISGSTKVVCSHLTPQHEHKDPAKLLKKTVIYALIKKQKPKNNILHMVFRSPYNYLVLTHLIWGNLLVTTLALLFYPWYVDLTKH